MDQLKIYEQLKVKVQLIRDHQAVPKIKVTSPLDVHKIFKDEVAQWDREKFLSVMLNARNYITAIDLISIGSLTDAVIHPREVFKSAILSNASSIILVHNHPSEDLSPSNEDNIITKRLEEAAEIIGITLLDHLIITTENYYSLCSGQTNINYERLPF